MHSNFFGSCPNSLYFPICLSLLFVLFFKLKSTFFWSQSGIFHFRSIWMRKNTFFIVFIHVVFFEKCSNFGICVQRIVVNFTFSQIILSFSFILRAENSATCLCLFPLFFHSNEAFFGKIPSGVQITWTRQNQFDLGKTKVKTHAMFSKFVFLYIYTHPSPWGATWFFIGFCRSDRTLSIFVEGFWSAWSQIVCFFIFLYIFLRVCTNHQKLCQSVCFVRENQCVWHSQTL